MILELLKKALEGNLISQEDFDKAKAEVESKKFSQEELDGIVSQRLEREKEKNNKLIEDLKTTLKDEMKQEIEGELNTLRTENTDLKTQIEEKSNTIKESKIDDLIKKNLGDKKILPSYLSMIKRTEDETELLDSIEQVYKQQKEDLQNSGLGVDFGSGVNPANQNKGFQEKSISEIAKMAFSE